MSGCGDPGASDIALNPLSPADWAAAVVPSTADAADARTPYGDTARMRPGLAGTAARQGGIFTRGQALASGYTAREFDRLAIEGRLWNRVRYGVYTTVELWTGLDERARRVLRDRAGLLVCADDAVLSHSSAPRYLGMPVHDVRDDLAHLTRRSGSQTSRTQARVKHHVASLDSDHVVTLDGCACTTPERTVLDLAREYGFHTALVAADAALQAGASKQALSDLAAVLSTEPHRPAMTTVAALADGRAQTPIETLGRCLLLDMGIDDLVLQHVVAFPEGGHAEVDLYSPSLRHVFECDGRVKYQDQYDARGEPVTAERVVWLEKRREDRIRGLGLGVTRLTWIDVLPQNFLAVSARIWREVEQQSSRDRWLPPSA